MEESKLVIDESSNTCIVSIGNVVDGFRFYGTFPNSLSAMEWASAMATDGREQDSWDVIELITPPA